MGRNLVCLPVITFIAMILMPMVAAQTIEESAIALRSANDQYVCAEGGGGDVVVANRNAIAAWETFKLIDRGNGNVALQAANGQYVCAEGGGGNVVVANRNAIAAWETFKLYTFKNVCASGCKYSSIQAAVDAANPGATIYVAAGTYHEDVNINKCLTIIGTGNPTATRLTLNAMLGAGSGGITAPIVYVNPTARIQDGVTIASSGGTVNVAEGTYLEDVNINKGLTLKGLGNPTAKSFSLTNSAILGAESGGITGPLVTVNPYSTITNGILLSSQDVHVYGNGGTYTYDDELDTSLYGNGIVIAGYSNPVTKCISIDQDITGKISGITANTVNVEPNAKIMQGIELANTGATVNVNGISGYTYSDDLTQDFYAKTITLTGIGNPITRSISLNQHVAGKISGIISNAVNVLNPNAKIQEGLTFAYSGGTVNVATGTYLEEVNINKCLTITGTGNPIASSFTLNAILGTGSVGITAPIVNVNPAAKIQDGVIFASSGGTVNVAAGTYLEDVNINKGLTLKGLGNPTAKSFSLTNSAILGAESGGITGPLVTVNPYSTITNGILLSSQDVHVYGDGGTYTYDDELDTSLYGNGIVIAGYSNPVTRSISINREITEKISGITANTVNVKPNAKIMQGIELANTGATVNVNGISGYTYSDDLTQDFYAKTITLTGINNPVTNSFTLNQDVAGMISGITANAVEVYPNAKIMQGIDLANTGATINANGVSGYTYSDDLTQNFYLKAITLTGINNPITSGISLDKPVAGKISGITANTVNVLNPNAKIQDGVTLTSSGGTVKVAAGTYLEDANINKDLTLKVQGNPTANSFSLINSAILGAGSGGITAPLITVNAGSKIQDGITLASTNGKVNVNAGTFTDNLDQSFYIRGVTLIGVGNPVTNSFTLNQVVDGKISGITANTVNVNPNAKIQDGVTFTSSGGTVKVAAGTYIEDVNINKDLTLKGHGNPTANSFALINSAILGAGSGGITAPLITVNAGSKIQDGITLASTNGKVNVNAGTFADNLDQSFYISGVTLTGFNNPVTNSFTLNQDIDGKISGITANTVNVNPSAKIQDSFSLISSGGTVKVAAGTYIEDVNINKDLTLKGHGNPTANSFALINSAILGAGSGGITAPIITVNAGSKIQDGITLASTNGEVNVNAGTFADNLDQSFYIRGVTLNGVGNPVTNSFTLNQDVDGKIRGITANTVNVDPNAKIQDGVTLSLSRGTVNAAAGTYKENPIIDKSLTVNGAGAGSTTVNGNKAGSIFTVGRNDPNIDVSLSGLTITGGTGTSAIGGILGGGIVNYGRLFVTDSIISGNSAEHGGGVYNYGTMTMNSGSITGNTGGGLFNNGGTVNLDGGSITGNAGGGLFNNGGTVNLDGSSITGNTGGGIYNKGTMNMNSGSITENTAQSGGGIFNYPEGTVNLNGGSISGNTATEYGGGIYSSNSMITFEGTQVVVTSNKAHLPSPPELSWYQGWGLYIPSVIPPTTSNGFDPATQVTGSTQI